MPTEWDLLNTLMERVELFEYDPELPLSLENNAYEPPADEIRYLEVLVLRNASNRMFLDGADPEWNQGILQLNIKTPLDEGPEEGVRIADALIAHFPSDLKLYGPDGLVVSVSKRPDRSAGFPDNGAWTTPVSVRYSSSF